MRLPLKRLRTAAVAVATAALLAGVGVIVSDNVGHSVGSGTLAGNAGPTPPAVLRVAHLHHSRVPFSKPLVFAVRNGALTSVTVIRPDGQPVAGVYSPSHSTWRSIGSFVPSTVLAASVSYSDLAHHIVTKSYTLRTSAPKHVMLPLLSPGNGDTVGVGSPVVVTFNYDVPTAMRAAVERRMQVVVAPAVVGAWHWMSDSEVHWRPPSYWRPGTTVTLSADLGGLDFGNGIWGDSANHHTWFQIGSAHVSEVDIATHTMHVYDNGKLIQSFPVSTGRDQYPTMDGVHIAIEKSRVVQMNSATVGIPKGNPDYYNETVYWDVRISDSGEFVHAAPWSVSEQGHSNVSHGCVNLSTANAEWFYNWSRRGDVIYVFDGVRPPSTTDPGTADWNMSWRDWVAGDAAPSRAAKRLHHAMPSASNPPFGSGTATATPQSTK